LSAQHGKQRGDYILTLLKKRIKRSNDYYNQFQRVCAFHLVCAFTYCIENPIHVFPEMKLCGLVPNSYIHVSVSYLYIPKIGLSIWLQQNRQTDPSNI
jgi:hypothetical protein